MPMTQTRRRLIGTTLALGLVLGLAGCGLVVEVRDPAGRPVPDARVMVQEDGFPAESRTTDAAGEARFRRVGGSGDWKLEISARGFARKLVAHPAGQRIPVVLEPGDEYQKWQDRQEGKPATAAGTPAP